MKINKELFKNGWGILKESFTEFSNDRVLKLSAALAYYTIFSLPSMLIVVIGLCSIFFGRDAIQGQVFGEISGYIGSDAAIQVQEILKKTALHRDSITATIIGLVTLLLTATGMFGEIQDSINSIWGLQTKPKKGFIKLLFNRLMSFSMLVVLGFILVVSLVVNALLAALMHRLEHYFSKTVISYLYIVDYGVMIAVTTILFAAILKVLPDAKILWKDVWVGAFATSILFLLGKFLIGYYLKHNASISAYGAAGSMILILLWVYYSAIILYFGAEFTQVYVKFKKRKIEPNKYAVWVEKNVVEKKLNTDINEHVTTIDKKTESINESTNK
jgi:membrane protein